MKNRRGMEMKMEKSSWRDKWADYGACVCGCYLFIFNCLLQTLQQVEQTSEFIPALFKRIYFDH